MTKALGIIAEYDPFHNGHAHMLKKASDKICEMYDCDPYDVIKIAAISGDFTQRGEPALMDKWSRAEMAMKQGFDLVVGIPVVFCCNNAGHFAKAGTEILESLGTEVIAFGSETADLQTLLNAAERRTSITDGQQEMIRRLVKEGKSYPAALAASLNEDIQFGPNDNLGIEYIRHMKTAAPLPVKRCGTGHDSMGTAGSISSASFIRRKLLDGEPLEEVMHLIPSSTLDVLKRESEAHGFCSPDMFFKLIAAKAAASSDEELNMIYGAEEGLGSKMKEEFRYCASYDELIDSLKSKRYTRTRIQRVILDTLLDIKTGNVRNAKNYIRILALNDRGAAHLKLIKKQGCPLPIVTNINKSIKEYPELEESLLLDVLAVDLYNTALKRDLYLNSEYVKKPLKYEGK